MFLLRATVVLPFSFPARVPSQWNACHRGACRIVALGRNSSCLCGLEQKYLHKKFTDTVKGKGKGRRETNESSVVLAVIWSKEQDKWLAE